MNKANVSLAAANQSDPPRARRGRPTLEEAEAINRKALDSALECFLSAGFDSATMEMIARKAGITKVTLYWRYPDKLSLMRAVVEDRVAAWSDAASRTDWILGDTLDQRLRHYARKLLAWRQNHEVRALRKLIMGSWGVAEDLADDLRQLVQAPMLDLLERDIAEHAECEGRPVRAPRQIAALFLGMLAGADGASGGAAELSGDALERYADRVVDILFEGRSGW